MLKVNSHTAAKNKYNYKTYDQIIIRVKKGLRDEYKQVAESCGLSLTKLITTAIDEYAENHKLSK